MTPKWLTKGSPQLIAAVLLGVTASGSIFGILQHFERFRTESQFRRLAEQRLSTARTRVAGALDTISLVASHFAVSQSTSRQAFSTLVGPALESHRYLQALEWIPRVKRPARARYERLARADGIPGFQFTERNQDGTMGAAGGRPEYFPVLYVEPLAGNERALGFDLGSNPVRLSRNLARRVHAVFGITN